MDIPTFTALLQSAANWGRQNGVVAPSLIDFDGLGYDPVQLMKDQRGFHDAVFRQPQGQRTFDPPQKFSAEDRARMNAAQLALVKSSRWGRG